MKTIRAEIHLLESFKALSRDDNLNFAPRIGNLSFAELDMLPGSLLSRPNGMTEFYARLFPAEHARMMRQSTSSEAMPSSQQTGNSETMTRFLFTGFLGCWGSRRFSALLQAGNLGLGSITDSHAFVSLRVRIRSWKDPKTNGTLGPPRSRGRRRGWSRRGKVRLCSILKNEMCGLPFAYPDR